MAFQNGVLEGSGLNFGGPRSRFRRAGEQFFRDFHIFSSKSGLDMVWVLLLRPFKLTIFKKLRLGKLQARLWRPLGSISEGLGTIFLRCCIHFLKTAKCQKMQKMSEMPIINNSITKWAQKGGRRWSPPGGYNWTWWTASVPWKQAKACKSYLKPAIANKDK